MNTKFFGWAVALVLSSVFLMGQITYQGGDVTMTLNSGTSGTHTLQTGGMSLAIDLQGGTFSGTSGDPWDVSNINLTLGDAFVSNGSGLVVGHTAQVATNITAEFQVLGTSSTDARFTFGIWSADNFGPGLDFVKSRNTTIGADPGTIVQDNDQIGLLRFLPDDGVDYATGAARFIVEVDDASPAAGDVGTAFVWEQMPGDGGALRETMRLSATGRLTVLGPVAYKTLQAAVVDGATTFAVTSSYVDLACTGTETIDTITGGVTGQVLVIQHDDTDCTLNDDDDVTAADAIDLAGAATNITGTASKTITLIYDGTAWRQVGGITG